MAPHHPRSPHRLPTAVAPSGPALSARPPRLAALALAAVAGAWLAGCASAPPAAPTHMAVGDYSAVATHLRATIDHEMQAHALAGLSVALVRDQQVLWSHGAGWADVAQQRPATPDTVYRMGSISKLFTVAAALQLAQQGRLALDAPLQQALPDFRIRNRFAAPGQAAAPITPRQLMTHHAGLPRDLPAGMWGSAVPDFTQVVQRLHSADAPYPPGQLMAYSNVGATVLGVAVQAAAGVPFAQHLQASLLGPLGMASASFDTGLSAHPAAARAHARGAVVDEPGLRDVPAGGLNASVLDLSRFLMMLFADGRAAPALGTPAAGTPVMASADVAEMLRVQNGAVPLDLGFGAGLGWMLATLGGEPLPAEGVVAHHGGATLHFRSQIYALPAHKLGVVVAANSGSAQGAVDRIARRALALALQAERGGAPADKATGPVADAAPPPPAATPWTEAALQAWPGDYATMAGWVQVRRDGARLSAEVAGRTLALVPAVGPGEEGWLGVRYALLGLLPLQLGELDRLRLQRRTVAGREVLVARMGTQAMLAGERLPPLTPGEAASAHALGLDGDYEPVLAPGEFRLIDHVAVRTVGGRVLASVHLVGDTQGPPPAPVRLLGADHAVVLGPLADSGPVVRRLQVNGQTWLEADGQRFRPRAR